MKPIDFGADGVNGCLDKHGRIVALNFYHAQHGYVTLTTADPFPDALRYDQAAVRAYRSSFATLDGFGILPQAPIDECITVNGEGTLPQTTLMLNDGRRLMGETLVDQAITYQRWCWGSATGEVKFVGRLSLQRCAYTQLTEGGVIQAPAVESRVSSARSASITRRSPHGRSKTRRCPPRSASQHRSSASRTCRKRTAQ